jgi:hypothetical protein
MSVESILLGVDWPYVRDRFRSIPWLSAHYIFSYLGDAVIMEIRNGLKFYKNTFIWNL